jgi:succinate-acetate transporter protein
MSTAENILANPAPLGLMAFGMTTVLLNLHNAGFFPTTSVVLAMGIFFGGLAQVVAGIMEFSKGNTFGVTAFTSYGFFWLTLVATWVLPILGVEEAQAPSKAFLGCYLALWGVFTFFMFLSTFKSSRVLQFVFISLAVLFFLLAIRDFTHSEFIGALAGYVGLFCGASAMYLSMAEVMDAQYGRKVLPY